MPERIDTTAIVIQRFAFGETSQVVHLLTEKLGRVVVLAKGAYREKNGFEGPLDLLTRADVRISLVQGRELGLLMSRRLSTCYPRLRGDLARFAAASHVLRQVLHFEAVGAGAGEAYRLVDRALTGLETLPAARLPLFVLAFDLKLAKAHGLAPEVGHCVRCGSPRALARFVPADGGVVCATCLARAGEGEPIDRATAVLMRELVEQPLARVGDPTTTALSRARRLVDAHLQWHADTAGASGARAGRSPPRTPGTRRSPLRHLPLGLALLAGCALSGCAAPGVDVDELSEEQLLVEAREKVASHDSERAIDLAEELIERTGDAMKKQEAIYLAAEAHMQEEEPVKAFRHYQMLLHDYPYSAFVPKCEAPLYAMGEEFLANEPWWLFRDLFSGRERGAEVMREFAASYPSSMRADDALNAIGEYRYSRKEFDQAVVFYAQLARNYPDSEWAELAAFRRGECWKLAARGAEYDSTPLKKAARNYRRYLQERPNGEHREQAQLDALEVDELLAQGELIKAKLYLLRDQAQGAQIHLANVALAFPTTKAAEEARRELELRSWDLSLNSIDTMSLPASEFDD